MPIEAQLALGCYGVDVRVRDVAGLGLVAYLHSRLPAEFAPPSRQSRVTVEYSVTVESTQFAGTWREQGFALLCDGVEVFAANTDYEVHEWLRDDIHQTVARRSPEFVFVHAAVVGWRGKAIVIPGQPSAATMALVVELLRHGATYYSLTFAVVDASGRVHPYRTTMGQGPPPEPLRIGLIMAGTYQASATWRPTIVHGTRASLPLVDTTVLPREASARIRTIAARIASSVVTVRGHWADAAQVARDILGRTDDLAGGLEHPTRTPGPVVISSRRRRLVAVVTPQHRYPLTADERVSLRHLREYLGGYDRYLIGPSEPPPEFSDFATRTFPRRDFTSIATYSRLLVSERFYRAFVDYEYILIYQFDALVFSSDLERWCQMGWDYVGAPWWDDGHPRQYGMRYDPQDSIDSIGSVGNGGLSLRKVDAAIAVLTSPRRLLNDVAANEAYRGVDFCSLPEDMFWSYDAAQLVDGFCIPRPREALQFAFETEPRFCFQHNDGRLPFGSHGWARGPHRAFWQPFLLT